MNHLTSKLKITSASQEERDWAARLLASSEPWLTLGISLDQVQKSCNNPEYLLFIASLDHLPAGMILLDKHGVAGSPYVKSVAVAEPYQSRGIGEELIKFSEELFRDEFRHMFLCVTSFNMRARTFYERLGYHIVGEFKDYLIEGASEILMYKKIR
jgi:[ribosomal protein S18]-alanine N-acetyltransferase